MHEEKLKAMARRLGHIVSTMHGENFEAAVRTGKTKRVQAPDMTVMNFTLAAWTDVQDVLNKLRTEPGSAERFGERTLREGVYLAIAAIMHGAQPEERSKKLVNDLDSLRPATRVYVPISGTNIGPSVDFEIPGISLVQMDDEQFRSVIAEHVPEKATIPRDIRDPGGVIVYEVGPSDLGRGLYATFSVDADVYRAAELVDEYIGPVSDFLQFALSFFTDDRLMSYVDYKSREPSKAIAPIALLDEATGQGRIESIVGAMRGGMGIAQHNVQFLTDRGIFFVAPLFGIGGLDVADEFGQMIHRAIRIFAEGERSHSPRQKILSYVTACELFFSQRIDTTKAVAEGVALVAGMNYEDRTAIRGAIERMYDARSSASHDGLEPNDLMLYRVQTREVLVRLIKLKHSMRETFRSKKDLTEWLDRQKFSGEVVP